MVLKPPQKKKILGQNLEKNLLKNRLSICVRNFAPLNEPLNIFYFFLFLPRSRPHGETLWCKNQENPSDRISHAWAPLMLLATEQLLTGRAAQHDSQSFSLANRRHGYPIEYCPAPHTLIYFSSRYLSSAKSLCPT
jgi:hypothetical protein